MILWGLTIKPVRDTFMYLFHIFQHLHMLLNPQFKNKILNVCSIMNESMTFKQDNLIITTEYYFCTTFINIYIYIYLKEFYSC